MKRHQLLKLLKLEKIIGKFSKEIGLDQKDILRMLLGENKNRNENNLMNINENLNILKCDVRVKTASYISV